MAYCPLCKTSGANIFYCEKCGASWCNRCLKDGKYPHLDKSKANSNVCPSCGYNGSVKPKP